MLAVLLWEALPPNPPMLSSGLFASVLPPVANLRLSWRGGTVSPPPLINIVKTHGGDQMESKEWTAKKWDEDGPDCDNEEKP